VRRSVPHPVPPRPIEAFLCARCLAKRLGRRHTTILSWLGQLAGRFPDCRIEVPNPRRHDPQYLWRVRDVWPLLIEWLFPAREN
jgi:hypothetical protein